jgi:regulation of enolase protein 1 (concanavalin A-like superfamily)
MSRASHPYPHVRRAPTVGWFPALVLIAGIMTVATSHTQPRMTSRATEIVDGHEAAAGRVIVKFRSEPRVADIRAQLDAADVLVLPAGLHLIRSRTIGTAGLIAALSSRPDVAYVEPDYLIHITGTIPNDPLFPQQWFLSNAQTLNADIHAPAAWNMTTGSGSHVIGVVDTGIDHGHGDLAANLWSAPTPYSVYFNGGQTRLDCPAGAHGVDAFSSNCDAIDGNGHGTGMAGIIGAVGNNATGVSGVNWRARIMDLRFLGPEGTGMTSDLINVLDIAIQLKQIFGTAADLRVLSNSFASSAYSQALADEIAKTNTAGILFVAAAGNSAKDNDVTPSYPASYNVPNVLAVAATSESDGLASYSDFGATSVDLGAPGDDITTTAVGNGSWTISGTSPATAVVSGVAGLILSQCDLATQPLRDLLMRTVDPVPALGGRTVSGGRVNAERALQQCSAGNQAPHMTFTGPADQSRFTVPATITLTADAVDADGQVKRVDFYVNGAYLGKDTTAPYSMDWRVMDAGTYSLTVIATDNQGATGTSAPHLVYVDRPTLPSPWASSDIGQSNVSGSASYGSGVFTVRGSGADIWDTSDAFRYVYQTLTGDGTIVARVASVENVAAWTKAGVMIRETLGASSAQAFMLVSAGKGVAFQRRLTPGGVSTSTGAAGTASRWVRLARAGHTITASVSTDGASWTTIGRDTFTMTSTVYVGLAVSSHDPMRLATAAFDRVSIASPPPGLPAGWDHRDIGAVGPAGSASVSDSTFTVKGGGADIWSTADGFQYAYTALSGDASVVARVASVENVAAWTKAGVMIRETLGASSAHALMLVSAGKGVAFQRRTTTGGVSTSTGAAGAAPRWVRLARAGHTITASVSTDGASWTVVGSDTFTMTPTVYVGLAVSSHDATRLATATFDQVSVAATGPLPSGWWSWDVGNVAVTGSGHASGGAFTVTGGGADIWGTMDAFHFVYRAFTGDGEAVARVDSLQNINAWTKAGIMIRETLDPDSVHALMLVSSAKGVAFQRRIATGGVSTSTGGAGATPRWVKLTRTGQTIAASTSADGSTWTVLGQDTFAFPANVYVGLAVSSHDATRAATAVFSTLTIVDTP